MLCYVENKITKEEYYAINHIMYSSDFYKATLKNDLQVKYNKNFDNIDWSKEPIESLKELHIQRAHQLRDSHSYLILYFSGGSDSTTVLNIFVNNNIPIDEIVIGRFSDIPDVKYSGQVAIDYLKSIDYKGKVTFVDINYQMINAICLKQLWTNNGYFPGLLHSFLRTRIDFFEKNNLIKSNYIRPSDTAHVYGEMCPIIKVFDKKYYVEFPVRAIGIATYQKGNIQFFTSEDFPQLHVKQSHVIVNYFKEHFPEETSILESDVRYRAIIKKLLRDPWDSRADFVCKTGNDGIRSLLNKNSEAFGVCNFYVSRDNNFKNNYYDSTVKEFVTSNLYKRYNRVAAPLSVLSPPKFLISNS